MSENAPRILKHTDDRHVQTRLDYMLIYKSESKAKIVRILETWMDTKYAEAYKGTADSKEQKSEPPAEDLWITMSYDQFSLFVYGTIQHDTIKQQVDELVASKHVERRIHPVYPYGPPQYRLNRELVQKSLDELEIPGNLFDLLPMFVTPRKKRTPQEKYPQGGGKKPTRDPGKIPPPTGETSHPSNNHTKNAKNPSKKEGTYSEHDHGDTGASAPSPAPFSSKLSRFFDNAVESAARFQQIAQRPTLTESTTAEEQVPFEPSQQDSYSHQNGQATSEPTPSEEKADSAGYEKDGRRGDRRGDAQQLSTLQASSAQASGKVSAHVEPKVLDVRTLTLKAHTTYVFSWLDEIRRECERDPLAGYVQSKVAQGQVRDLIVACMNTANELSKENVQMAWKAMWDAGKWQNGKSWRDPGMLTVKAFTEHYGEYLDRARAKMRKRAESALPSYGHMNDEEYAAFLRGKPTVSGRQRLDATPL